MVDKPMQFGLSRAYFKESLQLQRNEKILTSSSGNFLTTFFESFPNFFSLLHFNHSKRCRYNCSGNLFLSYYLIFHHLLNISSRYLGFHPSFPPSRFRIYNYNCTIAILQLQIICYNCRKCHQLHVKICPESKVE